MAAEKTMNFPTIAALSVVHLSGANSMYGLVYRNGYIKALFNLRDHGPHLLPGSNYPNLTRFVGIPLLDKLLTLAGVMFANITDGSAPQLSLYGFYFAGQLVSIFTVMTIEGLRDGNRGGIMSLYPLWGCAMQSAGYGFTMPIWSIVHLLYSKTAGLLNRTLVKAIKISDLSNLETLPMAFTFGYFVPTVLMAIPLPSNMLYQWLGGFWQGFPIWIAFLQYLIRRYHQSRGESPPVYHRVINSHLLYRAYLFAFTSTSISHIATFATLATCKLFPWLFSPLAQETLTFREVFIPPYFQSPGPMKSMASGIQNFFQYDQYVGAIAAFTWAVALKFNSVKRKMSVKEWAWLVSELIGVGLIAGPGGALVSLMWNRDEALLSDDKLHEDYQHASN